MKLKVLPITIAACFLLIALKTAEVTGAFSEIEERILPQEISLEEAPAENLAKVETAAGTPVKKEEEGKGDSKEKKEEEAPKNVHNKAPAENLPKYNNTEKVILEKLAARRAELEAWSKDLEMKEELINASSKKLDKKLEDLKSLKAETEKLLAEYKEQDDAKIRSLVKMYESMKPPAAAAILEEMEMGILLEIIDKMAEKKASLVLAKMTPKKAKQITEDLAKQRSLAQVGGVSATSSN